MCNDVSFITMLMLVCRRASNAEISPDHPRQTRNEYRAIPHCAQRSNCSRHSEKRVVGEERGENFVDFVQLLTHTGPDQLTETVVASWLRPRFRKWRDKVACVHHRAFSKLARRMLSPCAHHLVMAPIGCTKS